MKKSLHHLLLSTALAMTFAPLVVASEAAAGEYADFERVLSPIDQLPPDSEERVALMQAELEQQRAAASLPDRVMATLGIKTNDRVRELISLADDEWALREQLLKRQQKSRLQLFLNRYHEQLKMAAIAAAVAGTGAVAYKTVRDTMKENGQDRAEGAMRQAQAHAQIRHAMRGVLKTRTVKGDSKLKNKEDFLAALRQRREAHLAA